MAETELENLILCHFVVSPSCRSKVFRIFPTLQFTYDLIMLLMEDLFLYFFILLIILPFSHFIFLGICIDWRNPSCTHDGPFIAYEDACS